MHVLVIDDTATFRVIFTEFLEQLGYTVTSVKNGQEAFNEWTRDPNKNSLFLTDNDMPVMTGCQLVTALRNAGCTTPIIMASTNKNMAIQVLLTTGKLNGFILKGSGLTHTTLEALLKKVLGN